MQIIACMATTRDEIKVASQDTMFSNMQIIYGTPRLHDAVSISKYYKGIQGYSVGPVFTSAPDVTFDIYIDLVSLCFQQHPQLHYNVYKIYIHVHVCGFHKIVFVCRNIKSFNCKHCVQLLFYATVKYHITASSTFNTFSGVQPQLMCTYNIVDTRLDA